jgi:LCP family protein required for cell wall assembly
MTIGIAACSSASAGATLAAPATPPSTTTTLPPTTTTVAPTTTVPPTTTTTEREPVLVRVTVPRAPELLEREVRKLYEWVAGTRQRPPDLPRDLRIHLRREASLEKGDLIRVNARANVEDYQDVRVAVVTNDEDTIMAVTDGGKQWRIVGAHLASLGASPMYGPDGPRLVVVIGSDARPTQDPPTFRSDSLHLVAIDPRNRSAALVGIPRDSWVTGADGRTTKITNLMADTGPQITVDTVEEMSGAEIEGYLLTGFKGFVDMVGDLGGFDIDIPYPISDSAAGAHFDEGRQHLDPVEALAFARARKTLSSGDFTRQLHGGLVLMAAVLEARNHGIFGLPDLMQSFANRGYTNLDAEQMITLAATALTTNRGKIANVVLPGSTGSAGSASVVYLSDEAYAILRDVADGRLED